MTILAMVNADKEGQIESKMMKAVCRVLTSSWCWADADVCGPLPETDGRDSRGEEEGG